MDKRKVILDTDIGDDDAVALTALLCSDKVDLIGITTTHGNLKVEQTTENALRAMEYFNLDIPVYKGCSHSLVRNLTKGRDYNTLMETVKMEVDGKLVTIHHQVLPIGPTSKKAQDKHACSFIIDTLKSSKEKIDICAVGPLTNIALAIIMEPEIVNNIGTLYIMGGGLYIGNRTPVAEANFYDDPEAAEIVLNSGANIMLCPIEACEQGARITLNELEEIKKINNKASQFVYDVLKGYINSEKILFGSDDSCCVYDYAAVAPLIDAKVIAEERYDIAHVEISGGMADGQLVCDRREFVKFDKTAHVIYQLDCKKTKQLLVDLLKSYH